MCYTVFIVESEPRAAYRQAQLDEEIHQLVAKQPSRGRATAGALYTNPREK